MQWPKPEEAQIRAALGENAPHLADAPIAFLAEGWEFWAFTAGEHVLRFPKAERGFVWKLADQPSADSLRIEKSLTPELGGRLSTPIPIVNVYGARGPNGAPFAGHRYLPGEVVMYASTPPSPRFGRDLGRLLRELHAFPVDSALELGVPMFDGPRLRGERMAHYEELIRRAFPLLSCEARVHVERVYESYLNDSAAFEFEPVLVHSDIAVNALVDPASGELCGLLDFSDAVVSDPSLDLWLPVYGFEGLGIAQQTAACLFEAGIDEERLVRMMPQLAFQDLRYPLLGILHGLWLEDDAFVEESIRELNALVPRDTKC
jgi:aminoglycoside phosphotransferase (APT) family kinase protein